jgi:hypothetical protein
VVLSQLKLQHHWHSLAILVNFLVQVAELLSVGLLAGLWMLVLYLPPTMLMGIVTGLQEDTKLLRVVQLSLAR